jgi:hypothetical protein
LTVDNSAQLDATPGSANHDNPHFSSPASASAIEPVEPGATPGNGVNHGNAKSAVNTAAEQTSAVNELTEPSDPPGHGNSKPPASASEVAGGGHGNSSQASHTASAHQSAVTPPTEPAPGAGGAGPEPAFYFKNQASSSSPTAVVDLTELHDPLVHAELTAILETDQASLEVHGNSHVQNGQHHAQAHSTHELLP